VSICWNYLYLAKEIDSTKNEKERTTLINALRHGSISTWKHINLHGEYDFSDERMLDSVGLALPKNRPLNDL
jgi:hypothetical protein